MATLSVLDLVMIGEGKRFADALNESCTLAAHVEKHGYSRYWIAEHHDMPGIGSAATSLVISQVAQATSTLRVGSGGIMLPNHSPLIVAEQFGTLDTLYPGRVDLGIGRAPGAGGATVRAIRGDVPERDFSKDVQTLINYLADNQVEPVRAVHEPHEVPVWILGSSLTGASLAARLGLPFAFASHFAPTYLMPAITHYRENFRPSAHLDAPYVMVGANVFAAETHKEAEYLASSHQHWFSQLHLGRPGLLAKPIDGYMERLSDVRRRDIEQTLACTAIGDQETVGVWLRDFIRQTGADEVMIDSRIYDIESRCRSYQYAAQSIS